MILPKAIEDATNLGYLLSQKATTRDELIDYACGYSPNPDVPSIVLQHNLEGSILGEPGKVRVFVEVPDLAQYHDDADILRTFTGKALSDFRLMVPIVGVIREQEKK